MPAEFYERREALWRRVNKLHPEWSHDRKAAYVYGALRNMGWHPESEGRVARPARKVRAGYET